MNVVPREVGAQLIAPNYIALLGGNGLDIRRHLRGNPACAVAPGPDVALADAFPGASSEFAGQDGLPAGDFDSAIESCSTHDRGFYYLGSSQDNYQWCWTAYYRVSSLLLMNLSERVKTLREAAGWTQIQLAEKAGVSQQLIGKIEKNKVSESRKLPKIAAAFGLTVDELIHRTTAPRSERPSPQMSREERALIDAYRTASIAGKRAIEGAVFGVSGSQAAPTSKSASRKVIEDRPIKVRTTIVDRPIAPQGKKQRRME